MLDERLLNIRINQYLPDNREKSKTDVILIEENRLREWKRNAHNMFILGIIISMFYVSFVVYNILTTPAFSEEDLFNYTKNASDYIYNVIT